MKTIKLFTLIFALFITFVSNAQTPEKKAQKFVDEMTKVLELNEVDSKAVYQIQFDRFKENKEIQEKFAKDEEGKKEALKVLGNKTFKLMKAVLGEERQKKWKEYKENN